MVYPSGFYNYFCSNGCYNDFANNMQSKSLGLRHEPSHLKHVSRTQRKETEQLSQHIGRKLIQGP